MTTTQTIQITMTGQLPYSPYQSVFWTVYGDPDPTGALSGYGANYLLNIGVDTITILGAAVTPLSLTVGGDLYGTLPNPTVVGLQTRPVASTAPTSGQVLTWSGSLWAPSSSTSITSIDVPDGYSFSITQDTAASNHATSNMTISTQAPFASATGSNRLPGDLNFNIPAAAGALAGTQTGNYNFKFGGTNYLTINAIPGTECDVLFPLSAQLLGVTGVSSNADLNLYAPTAHGINFDIGGVPRLTVSHNPSSSITILTVSDSLLIDMPNDFSVTSVGDISIITDSVHQMDFEAGSISIDAGASLQITSNANVDIHSDNLMNITSLATLSLIAPLAYLNTAQLTIDPTGFGGGTDFTIKVANKGGAAVTGYELKIIGSNPPGVSTRGGDISIVPGVGSAHTGNLGIGASPSAGSGEGVIFIANRVAAPSGSPVGGGILYCEAGALKYKGSSGTVTTIAVA